MSSSIKYRLIIAIILNIVCLSASAQYYHGYHQRVTFVYDNAVKENIGDDLSEEVLQIFRNADINGDGKISVRELQIFQNWLQHNFRYIKNSTARHPDDFIREGGGNCEGFAVMTTCMLNYHGIVAFVAGFGRVTTNRHALTIVQVTNNNAPGYLFYTLRGWGLPPGYYIPVDYDKIGGLKAIDRRWKIAAVYKPKSLYWRYRLNY